MVPGTAVTRSRRVMFPEGLDATAMSIGAIKFIIVHHAACPGGAFHYRIDADGGIVTERPPTERGQHPGCIGIALEEAFDDATPSPAQMDTLHDLIVELKKRYASVRIGGHRQIRGDETNCPGTQFPLRDLMVWARTALIELRDEALRNEVEKQYQPR